MQTNRILKSYQIVKFPFLIPQLSSCSKKSSKICIWKSLITIRFTIYRAKSRPPSLLSFQKVNQSIPRKQPLPRNYPVSFPRHLTDPKTVRRRKLRAGWTDERENLVRADNGVVTVRLITPATYPLYMSELDACALSGPTTRTLRSCRWESKRRICSLSLSLSRCLSEWRL